MMRLRFRTPVAACCICFFISMAVSQECREGSEVYSYPRVILFMEYGDGKIVTPSREDAARVLGKCRTPEYHANSVLDYFEETYGVDTSPMRRSPYQLYENDQFIYNPVMSNPDAEHLVVISTFYEYAKSASTPFTVCSFSLNAKQEIRGPKKTLPAGSLSYHGMARWDEDGRDQCLVYYERTPITISISTGLVGEVVSTGPFDMVADHDLWGKGKLAGFHTNINGSIYASWILTFPWS